MKNRNILKSLADTEALGAVLAKSLKPPAVVYLQGELGAGKTTLVRAILRAFGYEGTVKSPTYTLVEPYDFGAFQLYHFDLYRLNDPHELDFIGLEQYFSDHSICLIEWPEKGAAQLPAPSLRIVLRVLDDTRECFIE